MNVVMNNTNIQLVGEVQFLGVMLDSRLTFCPHPDYISRKASKLFSALSAVSRPTLGFNSMILKIIYQGAVEPMVLYCVAAFQDILWIQSKL